MKSAIILLMMTGCSLAKFQKFEADVQNIAEEAVVKEEKLKQCIDKSEKIEKEIIKDSSIEKK